MRRFLALASFPLLALAAVALVAPTTASAQTTQTGPNGRTYRTFATLGGAETSCRDAEDVVWLMGSTPDATYTRKLDPVAGKSPGGTWACFQEALFAGFQELCAANDPDVWVDFQAKTWAVNGSSAYKQGIVGGFICLHVALATGFTQAIAKGTFEYLTPLSRVKCVSPDEVVWDSPDTRTIVRLTDLSVGKVRGGYVCRSLAELNGRKLTPTGYANAADANCKPPPADQVVWLLSATKSIVVSPDPAVGTGAGAYLCLSDAVNAMATNGYKLFGSRPGDITCAPPDAEVWANANDKTWDPEGSSAYGVGATDIILLESSGGAHVNPGYRYLCRSDALSRGWKQKFRLADDKATVKCTPPDQVVFVSTETKVAYALNDPQANLTGISKMVGGYACQNFAALNGFPLVNSLAVTFGKINFTDPALVKCTAPDVEVWTIIGSKTFVPLNDPLAGKGANGTYTCQSVATLNGYTLSSNGNATPGAAGCAPSDRPAWISNDTKTTVLLTDLSAGKGKGGFGCLAMAALSGYPLTPTGYANPGDAQCGSDSPAMWLNTPNMTDWASGSPGFAAQNGQGTFLCKTDATRRGYSDVSKVAGPKGSVDTFPQPSQAKCDSSQQVVWVHPGDSTIVHVDSAGRAGVGIGGYACWSNAVAQSTGFNDACDAWVYNDGKYAWPDTSQTYKFNDTPAKRADAVLGIRFMCKSSAAKLGIGPPPPGTPDNPGGPSLTSLTCFSGDKIEWILVNGSRVASGAPGAGQGNGTYLCATANGDHPYAGTSGATLLNGPKGSLLGFSAIPPDSIAYSICKFATKYGDQFSYGVMGQYGWVTDSSPYMLYIHGDSRVGKPPGHYACADDAVAAGWTPKKVNAP